VQNTVSVIYVAAFCSKTKLRAIKGIPSIADEKRQKQQVGHKKGSHHRPFFDEQNAARQTRFQ
jgi:hypothetical protein